MYTFSRLSTRYNNEIADPTQTDCHYVLADLFNETDPELDENHYARNPTVWFSVGHIEVDYAPFYTIEVNRYGMARFQYWPRTSENPEFEYRAHVTEMVARTLWDNLNRRKINTLIAWFLAQG